MNIENIKNAKFKKFILNILLIFAIMIILPGFISSLSSKVSAYVVKNIGETNQYDNTDRMAMLYNKLQNVEMDEGTLPSYKWLKSNNLRFGR